MIGDDHEVERLGRAERHALKSHVTLAVASRTGFGRDAHRAAATRRSTVTDAAAAPAATARAGPTGGPGTARPERTPVTVVAFTAAAAGRDHEHASEPRSERTNTDT